MESRIKQLREKRGLIQEILAVELGITQQMLSKYERERYVNKSRYSEKDCCLFQCNNRLFAGSFRCKKGFEWADENE